MPFNLESIFEEVQEASLAIITATEAQILSYNFFLPYVSVESPFE
jgi:hypothetical protein